MIGTLAHLASLERDRRRLIGFMGWPEDEQGRRASLRLLRDLVDMEEEAEALCGARAGGEL